MFIHLFKQIYPSTPTNILCSETTHSLHFYLCVISSVQSEFCMLRLTLQYHAVVDVAVAEFMASHSSITTQCRRNIVTYTGGHWSPPVYALDLLSRGILQWIRGCTRAGHCSPSVLSRPPGRRWAF